MPQVSSSWGTRTLGAFAHGRYGALRGEGKSAGPQRSVANTASAFSLSGENAVDRLTHPGDGFLACPVPAEGVLNHWPGGL